MNRLKRIDCRVLSVVAFSFLSAYLLSFLFEGQVLYGLLEHYQLNAPGYVLSAIVAHFFGLFSCGWFVKSPKTAQHGMLLGIGTCLVTTVPFLFLPSVMWFVALVISGYAAGCAVASWGYYLKTCTPKNQRLKSCADVLIYSNIFMIAINVVAVHLSCHIGLVVSMLCLIVGAVFVRILPTNDMDSRCEEDSSERSGSIKKPLAMLFLFVAVITINSGLMYQVQAPAFEHLTWLVSWYWAVPYIITLAIMRNLSGKSNGSQVLYVGIAMIMSSFISFMLLGRGVLEYLVVDTLMLGACGIFDLFWWSIIGEMLDYARNPVKVFGIGLSANVFGVLFGDVIGVAMTLGQFNDTEVVVVALTVVCVTLGILPTLNRQLVLLLKNHTYLTAYHGMTEGEKTDLIREKEVLVPLTAREQEVLKLILSGKSNREIAQALCISESTVKSHAGNIYSKYNVSGRAELISLFLTNLSDA